MTAPRCFLVASPEYSVVIPILDDGSGPTEWGCDAVYVRCRTKARARVLALRWFRRNGARYLDYAENPFAGMTVEDTAEWES